MALRIYRQAGGIGEISQEGALTNPILFSISQDGGSLEQRYYLRSSSPQSEAISDGTIYAVDGTTPDESSWITFAPDINGSAGPYDGSMSFDIPLNGEVPFWIKILVPQASRPEVKTDISIATSYIAVVA